MTKRLIALFLILGLASYCHAEKMMVPSWLPADQRFDVDCTSNEIAQIDHTLALMRDALHPKLKAQMKPEDLGPTLNWIVHVSLPGMTNEAAYFDSYKTPIDSAFFTLQSSFVLLTNRAARLSYVPPIVNLSLVYGDGTKSARARPVPGIDYPGVSYEDEGSTPDCIRLTLRAPIVNRDFTLRCNVTPHRPAEHEYKWVVTKGSVWAARHKLGMMIGVDYRAVSKLKECELAIFARPDGGCMWGPPSFVHVRVDPMGVHNYVKGQIESIDYGDFKDWYRLDEKGCILGFTRRSPGMIRGDEYCNAGEMMLESYSEERPKTTRVVKYSVVDGKLKYEITDEERHYKNTTWQCRSDRW